MTLRRAAILLWPYFRRHRAKLWFGAAMMLARSGTAAVWPWLLKQGIDALIARQPLSAIYWFAGAIVAFTIVKGVLQYWMRVLIVGFSRDIEYDLRNDLFAKLLTLSANFYARLRTGDIMARATSDLNAVRMMCGPGLMYQTETSIVLVIALVAMFSTDWVLALCAMAPAPFVTWTVIHFGRKIHERYERIQETFSAITSRVEENLSGVRVVRAYADEPAELKRFAAMNEEYIAQNLDLTRETGLYSPLLEAIPSFSFLIVLWAGGWRVVTGQLTLGEFVMFQAYLNMLVWPLIAFGWVSNLIQRGKASLARLREILDEPPLIAAPAQPSALPKPVRGELSFEAVTVRFGDTLALDQVTLHIPAGSTAAIVGHTGTGKTTLLQLIPRLLDPTSGVVRFDGLDVRDLDPQTLRREIAIVPQETFLFSDTIAANIALGSPQAPREALERAALLARLAPDLSEFPAGLDTSIGERGVTLSGGQRQRTAIARALLQDARVLVLDDALSAVDTITEDRILHELAQLRAGRTTILVSHRVSTVRDADVIFVLQQGRVAEQGSHLDLLARGGYYAELHQKQLLEEELESA